MTRHDLLIFDDKHSKFDNRYENSQEDQRYTECSNTQGVCNGFWGCMTSFPIGEEE
ncbi:unnamed protein product [Paramecium octaurelia]|uniref:Uncharacterized protein n=1 Tax=Paramecium octaurelia TaxID=43137 RepID=A0A8S1X7R6_PAROT|nr:unnamed protein product [Paramecium octaurelia]